MDIIQAYNSRVNLVLYQKVQVLKVSVIFRYPIKGPQWKIEYPI